MGENLTPVPRWCELMRWSPLPPEIEAAQEDLERLGNRIVELSARIQVATYHLLVLIREFDERGGWDGGFSSCAHWLSWRTGLNLGAAREKVRVARALADLPRIAEAMSRGEVSYSKVRAITRVASAECEEELLEFARQGSAAHVERLVRCWRRLDRLEAAQRDRTRRESRSVSAYWDEDGMLVLRGRLDPETGAVVMRALEAAGDRLYEADRTSDGSKRDMTPVEQRRADALGLIAESALCSELDAGTRGERYLVTLHVDACVLPTDDAGEAPPGMAMLEDGVDVSAETSRRLTCDCATVTMTHDADGSILSVGRKRRTISPALRRALTYRDPTCRFPGCGVRVCDGHHVQHWSDGGPTSLDNLVLLCRRHHVAVHEEGYRIEMEPDGRARFFHPRGEELPASPPPPAGLDFGDALLVDYVADKEVTVGCWTGSALCDAGPVDYSLALYGMRGPKEWSPPWAPPDDSPDD